MTFLTQIADWKAQDKFDPATMQANFLRRLGENQSAKTLSRLIRPTLLPSHKHISSPSTIKPESCPFCDGPQNRGYKKYGLPKRHHALIYGPNRRAKNRQMSTLTWEKWWLEMTRPLIPNTRNDTSCECLGPYFFLSVRGQSGLHLRCCAAHKACTLKY